MATKLKIMENEKHLLDDLKNDESLKNVKNVHTEGHGIWREN